MAISDGLNVVRLGPLQVIAVSGTTAIAIYAAVIGTLGLAWQIYSWRRAQLTNVRVTLSNAFIPGITEHAAMITAVNESKPCGQGDLCWIRRSGRLEEPGSDPEHAVRRDHPWTCRPSRLWTDLARRCGLRPCWSGHLPPTRGMGQNLGWPPIRVQGSAPISSLVGVGASESPLT